MSRRVKQALVGILSGVTGRDDIRVGFGENSRVHRVSKEPLSRADVINSPPADETFIDLSNKLSRSDDERLRRLEESHRQLQLELKESRKEAAKTGRELKWYQEETERYREETERYREETEGYRVETERELESVKFYNGLMTTRDLSAYNLLTHHVWNPLNNSIPSTITKMRGQRPEDSRESFTKTLQEFRGDGSKRYKALLDAHGSEGSSESYGEVLNKVEGNYLLQHLGKKGVKEHGVTSHDLRSGMRHIVKGFRRKRDTGAHPYGDVGLSLEDRKKVVEDVKASIPGRKFQADELVDESVLKVLSLACAIEEQEVVKLAADLVAKKKPRRK